MLTNTPIIFVFQQKFCLLKTYDTFTTFQVYVSNVLYVRIQAARTHVPKETGFVFSILEILKSELKAQIPIFVILMDTMFLRDEVVLRMRILWQRPSITYRKPSLWIKPVQYTPVKSVLCFYITNTLTFPAELCRTVSSKN